MIQIVIVGARLHHFKGYLYDLASIHYLIFWQHTFWRSQLDLSRVMHKALQMNTIQLEILGYLLGSACACPWNHWSWMETVIQLLLASLQQSWKSVTILKPHRLKISMLVPFVQSFQTFAHQFPARNLLPCLSNIKNLRLDTEKIEIKK